ncbi:GDSL-type esterase/lipase family protein, partial [Dactylosporangium matsuzakiense]|uniref:GDSL-type esterase/lipase family protein n=1 Tax=Dactylosporangium matsuzakiense TaxID=53360 RepID=UPI0022F2D7DD
MNPRKAWRTLLYLAVAATLTGVAAIAVARPALAATPVRVMPLGDSITGSPGCWRALLWQRLQSTGYTNVDFVGTLPDPGCGVAYDGNNEGHGGYLATGIASNNQLPAWLSATRPDIVIMHLGTNDVWSHLAPSTITNAYTTLLGQMRASNPNIKLIIAKILPMSPSGCSDCYQGAINLDNAIPAWAAAHSTTQSPITVVDQWSGFNTGTDTVDGVHPNSSGNQKIADRWYPALTAALGTATPLPGATTLVNPVSGRCLDIAGGPAAPSGSAAQLWDCNA